jgi:hypothetical protein
MSSSNERGRLTMGSDADGVAGRIKGKAKAAIDRLMGEDDRGDADPDVEYEEAPDQHILHEGMVVLSGGQGENASGEDSGADAAPADAAPADAAPADAAPADESGGTGDRGDARASTG